MGYEIQKRSTTSPDIWYMVAQTDVKAWAEKIAAALECHEGGEFRVKSIRREEP